MKANTVSRWKTSKVVAGVSVAMLMAGCGVTTSAAAKPSSKAPISVVIVGKMAGMSYFTTAYAGAKSVEAKFNEKVTLTGPTTASGEGQAAIIQSLIPRHPDVIAISADDPSIPATALEDAMHAGIKVMSFDSDVLPQARQLYVVDGSFHSVADNMVNQLVKAMGTTHAQIAIESSTPDATTQVHWIKDRKALIAKKYPGLTIVNTQYGYDTAGQSLQAGENILTADPHVKGIIGPDTYAVIGAAEAVDKLGEKGKVQVDGLCMPNQAAPYINNGTMKSCSLWHQKEEGKLVAYFAWYLVHHGVPKEGPISVPFPGHYVVGKNEAITGLPVLNFTKSNVANYNF